MGPSAMEVEEDGVGLSTIEVMDKHVGPLGFGNLEVLECLTNGRRSGASVNVAMTVARFIPD